LADPPLIVEDLRQLAAEAAAVARERCGQCQTHHMLWPLNRAARVVSAADGGREDVVRAIAHYAGTDRRRILIAGSSDTGVLCLAANAVSGPGADFVVVDLCDTPLELCRRFATRWGLQVETHILAAQEIEFTNEFDIVIAHSLFQFVPTAKRLEVFTRFAAALKPGGVAIQVFNAGGRIEGVLADEHARDYPHMVLARFEQSGLPLPEPREKLLERLQFQSLRRRQLEGAVAHPEEFEALMESAGFSILERRELDDSLADSYGRLLSKVERRRYLSVARVNAPAQIR
jgi:hypothetical protein